MLVMQALFRYVKCIATIYRDLKPSSLFQGALYGACGKSGQNVGSLCVALYSFGTCITFLIIIGDQFDRALASLYGPNFCAYWYVIVGSVWEYFNSYSCLFATGICGGSF